MKSNNALDTLLSSGFETSKNPSPYVRMEKPAYLRIKLTSKPGSVKLTTAEVTGAMRYFFQFAPVPSPTKTNGTSWAAPPAQNHRQPRTDKQYTFRVGGVEAAPPSPSPMK